MLKVGGSKKRNLGQNNINRTQIGINL